MWYFGCPAGVFPVQRIPVQVSLRSRIPHASSVNRSNLIVCPITAVADGLNLSLLNIRSVRNKTSAVIDIVNEYRLDMLALTETWLQQEGDGVLLSELTPPNFEFLHVPRETRGGGVGFLFRNLLKFSAVPMTLYLSFEYLEVFSRTANLRIAIIYRPPPSSVNKLSVSLFLEEFADYIHYLNTAPGHLIILGDFNLHLDCPEAADVNKFISLLDSVNLVQHVSSPTHDLGHILDLVISRSSDHVVDMVQVSKPFVSDHMLVTCKVEDRTQPVPEKSYFTFRRTHAIDVEAFREDLLQSSACYSQHISVLPDLLRAYNSMETVLDKHAPLIKRLCKSRKKNEPWFTQELVSAIKVRRQHERRWHKSGLSVHKNLFVHYCKLVRNKIASARKDYFAGKIMSASNSRELFQTVDSISGRSAPAILPDHLCEAELAERFSFYFSKKICDLCNSLDAECPSTDVNSFLSSGPIMDSFTLFAESDISDIITGCPTKSCKLDILPTELVKNCVSELSPIITKIVNQSLASGIFPDNFKVAHVTPLLKKSNLDKDALKNYRPVSNLSFISKVVERAVLSQLMDHLNSENLLEPYQSAYKPGHSTETALNSVHNFIASELDKNRYVLLVLLDLSSAFDTVSHSILLETLRSKYKVGGTVISWFDSYLSDRYQQIKIRGTFSTIRHVTTGVPQGSVLGPVLFSLYLAGLSDIMREHGIHFHHYADDTQLYISFDKFHILEAFQKMEACIKGIHNWLTLKQLKLNCDKTECIVFRSRLAQNTPILPALVVGDTSIHASSQDPLCLF